MYGTFQRKMMDISSFRSKFIGVVHCAVRGSFTTFLFQLSSLPSALWTYVAVVLSVGRPNRNFSELNQTQQKRKSLRLPMLMQSILGTAMRGHGAGEESNELKIPPQAAITLSSNSKPFLYKEKKEENKEDVVLDIQRLTSVKKVQLNSEETLEQELAALSIHSVQSFPTTEETTQNTERADELGSCCPCYLSEDFEPHALGVELREEELQEAFQFFAEDIDSLDNLEDPIQTGESFQEALIPTHDTDTENFSDILERDLNPDLISALETLSEELFSR